MKLCRKRVVQLYCAVMLYTVMLNLIGAVENQALTGPQNKIKNLSVSPDYTKSNGEEVI